MKRQKKYHAGTLCNNPQLSVPYVCKCGGNCVYTYRHPALPSHQRSQHWYQWLSEWLCKHRCWRRTVVVMFPAIDIISSMFLWLTMSSNETRYDQPPWWRGVCGWYFTAISLWCLMRTYVIHPRQHKQFLKGYSSSLNSLHVDTNISRICLAESFLTIINAGI